MIDFLQHLIAFVFTLGLLVTFHEFGHFWVARKCDVKILRFSIGFGKPLWSRHFGQDKSELVIAAGVHITYDGWHFELFRCDSKFI